MSALRPAALLGTVAVVCLCAGAETNGVSAELSREIGHALEEMHMTRRAPDDFISRRAFTNLLDACDARHMVFLAGDVAEFAKSRDKLDDMFKAGDFSFARRVRERYRMRLKECTAFATNALAGALHPVGNPSAYVFDRSHERWAQDARDWVLFRDRVMVYGLQVLTQYEQSGEPPCTLDEFAEGLRKIEIDWTSQQQ